MIAVETCGINALPHVISSWKPDVVVSAVNAECSIEVTHVNVQIDDIYNVQLLAYKNAIRAVLAAPGERFLVHCQHGLSRSAALAIAKIYQVDPSGVEVYLEAHPQAEPNPLLLLLADEILEAHGDLLKRCKNRYKGRKL